jgi:vesicle transport protein SEC22
MLTHCVFLFMVLQVIQRKRRDFLDPSSRDNMARLNNDLADIHDIMKKNIQEV